MHVNYFNEKYTKACIILSDSQGLTLIYIKNKSIPVGFSKEWFLLDISSWLNTNIQHDQCSLIYWIPCYFMSKCILWRGGGVVQWGLQRERGSGDEQWVSRSSANEEHLCLIAVISVERPDKEKPENVEKERETGRRLESVVRAGSWKNPRNWATVRVVREGRRREHDFLFYDFYWTE